MGPVPGSRVAVTGHDHDAEVEQYGECITCQTATDAARRSALDEALERVEENADPEWLERARAVVLALAAKRRDFTTDEIWPHLPPAREPRALGAVMRQLADEGRIIKTETHRPSVRPECHSRPVAVWLGLG